MNEEAVIFLAALAAAGGGEIGRASCRERGEISGGAGSLKKKKQKETPRWPPSTQRFKTSWPNTQACRSTSFSVDITIRFRFISPVVTFFFFFKQKTAYEIGQ